MTTINFPDVPTIGQIYTVDSRSWIWTGNVWNAVGYQVPAGETVFVGTTPPTTTVVGKPWFNPTDRVLSFWTGSDWVTGGLTAVSSDGTVPPGKLFVGQEAPADGQFALGDLWNDIDENIENTDFIYTGPEAPANYATDTLWIDTDEPELPLIYSDNEPPTYTPVDGDFWVDLDDTSGQSILSSLTPPQPSETEFWLDLTSEQAGSEYVEFKDFFKDGAAQIANLAALPSATVYPGITLYVVSEKSLYSAIDGVWKKTYPDNGAEVLAWMGF